MAVGRLRTAVLISAVVCPARALRLTDDSEPTIEKSQPQDPHSAENRKVIEEAEQILASATTKSGGSEDAKPKLSKSLEAKVKAIDGVWDDDEGNVTSKQGSEVNATSEAIPSNELKKEAVPADPLEAKATACTMINGSLPSAVYPCICGRTSCQAGEVCSASLDLCLPGPSAQKTGESIGPPVQDAPETGTAAPGAPGASVIPTAWASQGAHYGHTVGQIPVLANLSLGGNVTEDAERAAINEAYNLYDTVMRGERSVTEAKTTLENWETKARHSNATKIARESPIEAELVKTMSFDCYTGYTNKDDKQGWSPTKIKWCCQVKQIACNENAVIARDSKKTYFTNSREAAEMAEQVEKTQEALWIARRKQMEFQQQAGGLRKAETEKRMTATMAEVVLKAVLQNLDPALAPGGPEVQAAADSVAAAPKIAAKLAIPKASNDSNSDSLTAMAITNDSAAEAQTTTQPASQDLLDNELQAVRSSLDRLKAEATVDVISANMTATGTTSSPVAPRSAGTTGGTAADEVGSTTQEQEHRSTESTQATSAAPVADRHAEPSEMRRLRQQLKAQEDTTREWATNAVAAEKKLVETDKDLKAATQRADKAEEELTKKQLDFTQKAKELTKKSEQKLREADAKVEKVQEEEALLKTRSQTATRAAEAREQQAHAKADKAIAEAEAAALKAIEELSPTEDQTPNKFSKVVECNGWSPDYGDRKGQGASCDYWNFTVKWCWVDNDYHGYGFQFVTRSTSYPNRSFVPCSVVGLTPVDRVDEIIKEMMEVKGSDMRLHRRSLNASSSASTVKAAAEAVDAEAELVSAASVVAASQKAAEPPQQAVSQTMPPAAAFAAGSGMMSAQPTAPCPAVLDVTMPGIQAAAEGAGLHSDAEAAAPSTKAATGPGAEGTSTTTTASASPTSTTQGAPDPVAMELFGTVTTSASAATRCTSTTASTPHAAASSADKGAAVPISQTSSASTTVDALAAAAAAVTATEAAAEAAQGSSTTEAPAAAKQVATAANAATTNVSFATLQKQISEARDALTLRLNGEASSACSVMKAMGGVTLCMSEQAACVQSDRSKACLCAEEALNCTDAALQASLCTGTEEDKVMVQDILPMIFSTRAHVDDCRDKAKPDGTTQQGTTAQPETTKPPEAITQSQSPAQPSTSTQTSTTADSRATAQPETTGRQAVSADAVAADTTKMDKDIKAMEDTLQGIDATPEESRHLLDEVRNDLVKTLDEAKRKRAAQVKT
eukprot:TRINITY_DN9624_c0_g1_i1.p1 TRINITY_DN9624_c0_g1~~TRINITY_DN9624_c0_g1_i1.p1  ORF type:complete len:1270 (+),score=291.99 TRINITY_DN9624_c0_g1_i1:79-3810(+)